MLHSDDPVLAPISGAEHREIGGIEVDTVCVGAARVKRMVYRPGFRWSTNIKQHKADCRYRFMQARTRWFSGAWPNIRPICGRLHCGVDCTSGRSYRAGSRCMGRRRHACRAD